MLHAPAAFNFVAVFVVGNHILRLRQIRLACAHLSTREHRSTSKAVVAPVPIETLPDSSFFYLPADCFLFRIL